MSLVNDMLRDLDQRRNESTGGSGKVTLTPAPDIPRDGSKRPIMLYLIVALVVGAGALAWFWQQQGGESSRRELNIAPQVVFKPDVSIPAAVEPLPQSVVTEDASPVSTASANPTSESGTARSSISAPEVVANTPIEEVSQQQSIEQTSNESSRAEEIVRVEDPAIDVEPDVQTDRVDLTEGPAEEVKNAVLLTSEEKDLLAVQEALGLIANNDSAAAYTILEQQILDNRYAHQSRETYAKLLMNEGNLRGALELVESGLGLSPNHSGFKKIKARLLITQGELNDAVELLIARAPEVTVDVEYHDILATAQLASRDYQGALISYTGLVQTDQAQGKWWYGFAASQDSLGNARAARQGYSQAVSLSNLSASLRRRSQERLAQLGQ